MMEIETLASSSHGNAYIVSDGQTRILLECGLAYRTLQNATGFTLSTVDAVLVSHEHKDHSRCVNDLLKNGAAVYMTFGTAYALGLIGTSEEDEPVFIPLLGVKIIEAEQPFTVGTMHITAFNTFHDAMEPVGYMLQSGDEVLVFATDTVNLRYRFLPPVTTLAIEANYDNDILERSARIPDKTKDRIRNTHMCINTLLDILHGMDLSRCRRIILLHLSDATSNENYFIHKVKRAVPYGIDVCAAGREGKRIKS